jgi:hypothetical protein
MYHSESRVIRILSIAGTVVGLATGLITLYSFVTKDGSLLGWFGVETFHELAVWAGSFGERWTFGPFLTALLVYGIVTAIVFALDRFYTAAEYVGTLLLLFPLPSAWIWLFSNVVSRNKLLVFLVGYSAIPWISVGALVFAMDAFEQWLKNRRAVVGIVREVKIGADMFLGREHTVYMLILDREASVPVTVKFSLAGGRQIPARARYACARVRAMEGGRFRRIPHRSFARGRSAREHGREHPSVN